MSSCFLDFLHRISPLVRALDFYGCDRLDLDPSEVGLEAGIEGEAISFSHFSGLGIFKKDFELCAGERLEMSFEFVGRD